MGPPGNRHFRRWVCNALLVAQEAVEARTTDQLPVTADLNRIQKVESVAGGSQVHVGGRRGSTAETLALIRRQQIGRRDGIDGLTGRVDVVERRTHRVGSFPAPFRSDDDNVMKPQGVHVGCGVELVPQKPSLLKVAIWLRFTAICSSGVAGVMEPDVALFNCGSVMRALR